MTSNRRLKPSEVADYRQQLLAIQNHMCCLCDEIIEDGKAVLDHDHGSGHIRGVLHRGCNAMEGVLVNNMARNLMTWARLQALFHNIQAYQAQHQPELHPTHRTPEERQQRARKRAQARRKPAKKK
jgi:hypothetical protein